MEQYCNYLHRHCHLRSIQPFLPLLMVLNDADEGETYSSPRRRLTAVMGDTIPSYMNALTKDLQERQLLFKDTPPDEIKYWFEYTGPLQVRGYIIRDVILYTLHYTCLLCFLCCITFLLCSVFCVLCSVCVRKN